MNKTITITLPHSLSEDEVKQRLVSGLNDARTRFGKALSGVQESWSGNHADFRVTALGQSINGRVDIQGKDVQLQVDLPLILAVLADKIRPHIEREGRKLLDGPKQP